MRGVLIGRYPAFDDGLIGTYTSFIKARLRYHLVESYLQISSASLRKISRSTEAARLAVYLALALRRYGAIYWLSRYEANRYIRALATWPTLAGIVAEIDGQMSDELSATVFNRAVYNYLTTPGCGLLETADPILARNAIASLGRDQFMVRASDLARWRSGELDSTEPVFDLHDLAHQLTSCLDPSLYANKYMPGLACLPAHLRRLVTSPHISDDRAIPFSDGTVFTEFLNGLFVQGGAETDDTRVVGKLAGSLASFFSGSSALWHPSLNRLVKLSRPVDGIELAVLVQNKFYELPASEIERTMFTRGGVAGRGDRRSDELTDIPPLERLYRIAEATRSWLHFERRNTLKHRAHFFAYQLYYSRFGHSLKISARLREDLECLLRWEMVSEINVWAALGNEQRTSIVA